MSTKRNSLLNACRKPAMIGFLVLGVFGIQPVSSARPPGGFLGPGPGGPGHHGPAHLLEPIGVGIVRALIAPEPRPAPAPPAPRRAPEWYPAPHHGPPAAGPYAYPYYAPYPPPPY